MAINKKLIHFETLEQFQSANGLNSKELVLTEAEYNNLNSPQIPYRSIVFIKDKKKIWTHGKYYDSPDSNDIEYEPVNTGTNTFIGNYWKDIYELSNCETGSYVILLQRTSDNITDLYTGYFSIIKNNVNNKEEIVLNRSLNTSIANFVNLRLYARIYGKRLLLSFDSSSGFNSADLNSGISINLTIKIRKIL